jgi:DNA-binding FadR family transcriptional regulator
MIQRERLHDQVVRELALRIMDGGLQSLPPEPDLCKDLKVSRTILREAVKVLAAKGMVEVGPKVGTRVLPRKHWNLLDPKLLEWQSQNGMAAHFFQNICEVREIIEPAAAELAAKRATKGEIAEIEHAWKDMKENWQNTDAYIVADLRLHANIFAASHNELLQGLAATIQTVLRTGRDLSIRGPHGIEGSLPLHEQLVRGICTQNAPAARKTMVRIIRMSGEDIGKALAAVRRQKDTPKRQKHTHAGAMTTQNPDLRRKSDH